MGLGASATILMSCCRGLVTNAFPGLVSGSGSGKRDGERNTVCQQLDVGRTGLMLLQALPRIGVVGLQKRVDGTSSGLRVPPCCLVPEGLVGHLDSVHLSAFTGNGLGLNYLS